MCVFPRSCCIRDRHCAEQYGQTWRELVPHAHPFSRDREKTAHARGRVHVTGSPLFPYRSNQGACIMEKQALRGARCSSSFLVSGRRHDSLSQAASATGQPPVSCHTCSDLEDTLTREYYFLRPVTDCESRPTLLLERWVSLSSHRALLVGLGQRRP